MSSLAVETANVGSTRFPEYTDPFESHFDTMAESPAPPNPAKRLLGNLQSDPSRHPSPQPTHFSVPQVAQVNGNGHRVLRSATVGYVAPEFKGKVEQMKQGEPVLQAAHSVDS